VTPRLIIGLGEDAEKVLTARYPDARQLSWPFKKPRTVKQEVPDRESRSTSTRALDYREALHPPTMSGRQ
jgi:hypothetical protein